MWVVPGGGFAVCMLIPHPDSNVPCRAFSLSSEADVSGSGSGEWRCAWFLPKQTQSGACTKTSKAKRN